MDMQTILLVIFGPILLAFAALGVVGNRARKALKAKFPPPGQLVDIGGYRLHLYSQGQGEPVVVMDAGVMEPGLGWSLVQPEIARFARAVVYDRAGLGWSDPSPQPRTADIIVEELRTLLQKSGLRAPYILVGHSLGGLHMRVYAYQYPQEVAGLVLVDSAHEGQYTSEGMQKAISNIMSMMPRMMAVMKFLVWTGLPAMFPSAFRMLAADARFPQPAREAMFAMRAGDLKYFRSAAAEFRAILDSHARVREMNIAGLGDLPLIVIQHGKVDQMMTPELTELNEETNRWQQAELAKGSTRARLIVAGDSGHAIPIEQPEIIVAAVREMVSMLQPSKPPINDPSRNAKVIEEGLPIS